MSGIDHTGKVGGGGEFAKQATNWPSPRSEDSEACGNHPGAVDSRGGAAKLWTTPQAHDTNPGDGERLKRSSSRGGYANLTDDVMRWPTPNAQDGKQRQSPESAARRTGKHQIGIQEATALWGFDV